MKVNPDDVAILYNNLRLDYAKVSPHCSPSVSALPVPISNDAHVEPCYYLVKHHVYHFRHYLIAESVLRVTRLLNRSRFTLYSRKKVKPALINIFILFLLHFVAASLIKHLKWCSLHDDFFPSFRE